MMRVMIDIYNEELLVVPEIAELETQPEPEEKFQILDWSEQMKWNEADISSGG